MYTHVKISVVINMYNWRSRIRCSIQVQFQDVLVCASVCLCVCISVCSEYGQIWWRSYPVVLECSDPYLLPEGSNLKMSAGCVVSQVIMALPWQLSYSAVMECDRTLSTALWKKFYSIFPCTPTFLSFLRKWSCSCISCRWCRYAQSRRDHQWCVIY